MHRRFRAILSLTIVSALALGAPFVRAAVPSNGDELQAFLLASALRSSDLRTRIVWSINGIEQRADGRWYSIETIPIATLVDQTRGSTDPVVLEAMTRRCLASIQPRHVCDPLSFALRWAAVDAENQRAWLAVASILRDRGELDSARAMFRRAALAPAWHESLADLARSLAAAIPPDLPAVQRNDALATTYAKASGTVASQSLVIINTSCKEAQLRVPCERIIETMARDAESLIAIRIAANMAERTALPSATIQAIRQRADAMQWAESLLVRDDSLPDVESGRARIVGSILASGELKALGDVLQQAGIDEREAARRYLASLTPAQKELRKQMSTPLYGTTDSGS